MKTKKYYFLQMKGFGDALIAVNFLKKFGNKESFTLVANSNLHPLLELFQDSINIQYIDILNNDTPEIFNIREKGIFSAVKSFQKILFLLKEIQMNRDDTLVVDYNDFRDSLVTSFVKGRREYLVNDHNIYSAFFDFFKKDYNHESINKLENKNVAIFPYSRDMRKCMPIEVVNQCIGDIQMAGFDPIVYSLKGEFVEANLFNSTHVTLPKKFDEIFAVIKNSSKVISVDSVPAHIAEFFGVSVYVFNRAPNTRFLPYSAYLYNYWSLFHTYCSSSLNKFLLSK